MSDIAALLQGVPLLAELDTDTLGRVAEHCVSRSVGAGHSLFRAGDLCRGLYVVESGRVRIYRTSLDGREQILHIEGPGRPVAELPLFDGGPYPASAMTIEPSRLLFLPRAAFERLYRSHPDIAQAIIRSLVSRLRHLVHVTETLAFHDVAARLALLLARYASEGRASTASPGGGVEIQLNRTHAELALEIGTARESVSRALKQLTRKNLIEMVGRGRIRIPDLAKLRSAATGG
jgi:CRP/FNR family transcriptional regulator